MFVGFGLPEEWKAFENSHPVFVQIIRPLFQTIHKVFARAVKSSAPDVDRLVFHLGMLCVEDFKEILLLCANGFGIGGQKIMRGLYEKAVTADYLSVHANEARKFLDYFWVHTKKDINHQKNVYGKDHWDPRFEAEVMTEYAEVKDQFMEDLCRNCGTKKPMMSWTKLNVQAMAKAAKSPLADLYLTCYFVPTLQTHTTMGAIFARLNPLGERDTVFKAGPKREEAEAVLKKAHFIILNMLNTQFKHFNLDIEDELLDRAKDFNESWESGENAEDPPETK